MSRDAIINLIRANRARLDELQVKSLALFGSVARGDDRPDSDVDILVEFEGPTKFDNYMDLLFFLEEIISRKVDLVTKKAVKPRLWPYINPDLTYVA
ncbi:MAG: nucleotidyltransferase family protein [Calditrichaeota bacterium]|nr:nucleotidyltransferase family protein [Calditrichota bacterium]